MFYKKKIQRLEQNINQLRMQIERIEFKQDNKPRYKRGDKFKSIDGNIQEITNISDSYTASDGWCFIYSTKEPFHKIYTQRQIDIMICDELHRNNN